MLSLPKPRKLIKCPACRNLQLGPCARCDGDGYVYADTVDAYPKLKLLPSVEHAAPPPPPEPEVEVISEAELLAAQRYSMAVWKQRIERELARLDEQLLEAMAADGLNKVYADSGIGYVRARKWAAVEDSPYILRQIEMRKDV